MICLSLIFSNQTLNRTEANWGRESDMEKTEMGWRDYLWGNENDVLGNAKPTTHSLGYNIICILPRQQQLVLKSTTTRKSLKIIFTNPLILKNFFFKLMIKYAWWIVIIMLYLTEIGYRDSRVKLIFHLLLLFYWRHSWSALSKYIKTVYICI